MRARGMVLAALFALGMPVSALGQEAKKPIKYDFDADLVLEPLFRIGIDCAHLNGTCHGLRTQPPFKTRLHFIPELILSAEDLEDTATPPLPRKRTSTTTPASSITWQARKRHTS